MLLPACVALAGLRVEVIDILFAGKRDCCIIQVGRGAP